MDGSSGVHVSGVRTRRGPSAFSHDFCRNLLYGADMLNPGSSASPAATLAGERRLSGLPALAVVLLVASVGTIFVALAFEHIGGYQPCALCLMQRTPYYLGAPVAALAVVAAWFWPVRSVLALLFAAFAALMLYGGGVAIYHAGVEWGFWEGPAACAEAPGGGSAADMLGDLGQVTLPSCTEANWRFLGLSFAGWNVLVSAALAALGLYGARQALRRA